MAKSVSAGARFQNSALVVMAAVTLWRKDLLVGLFASLILFFSVNALM